jgi:sarcosine oxidase, subunit beta
MNTESADVVVVGGGSTGCSIACHLAEHGAKVWLYDQGAVGAGTTGDSPGIVRAFYHDPILTELARECLHLLRQWDEESGGDCGYSPCGFLTGLPHDAVVSSRKIVESNSTASQPMSMLSPVDALAVMSDISQSELGSVIYEPLAGYCDARATARYLASRARRSRARVIEGVRIHRILIERDEVGGVETADGVVRCPVVVNAAGVWAPQLAAACHLPLPIRGTLRGLATVSVPGGIDESRCGYGERALGFYMRPHGPGSYLLGSLLASDSGPASPSDRNLPAAPAALEHYTDYARARLSRFRDGRTIESRFSLFDETPDGNPIVGRDPRVSGMWLAAGLSGHGFKFCPAFGRGLADLIVKGTTSYDFSLFSPCRSYQ